MSRDHRALLVMIPLLSGCLVLTSGDSDNTGEINRHAINVYANAGDPAVLSCDVFGSVANFGWRKIGGQPTSEDDITKLTEKWQWNETYWKIRLYFRNCLERDAGLYECWAEIDKNLSVKNMYSLHVKPYSSPPHLPVVALDKNRICLSWDFQDIYTYDSSFFELDISRNENNTPYWNSVYELRTSEFNGVLVTTVPKQNTAYWFRYILKYGNAEDFFFSKWTKTPKEGIDPPYDPVVLIKETSVDSITIEWLEPPLEMQNCLSHYDVYMYEMKGGDEPKFKEVLCTEKNVAKFENLRTSVSYKFRLVLCVDPTCKEALYPSLLSENFVPKDRDPKFIPNVSVIKTSVASIAIAWNAPPVELQDRIYYYKVALGTEDFTKKLYVHKTVHSHTFENLSPNKIHRIKVAACSDYKTQCGNWSEEQEGFTYNAGEMITGAAHVYANAGDPVALSCDLSRPVTKFGWRKIQGQPTSEENIIKLTESWQLSKTFRITRLYFTNSLERDAGLYECWAEDSENFSLSFLYSFHVEPSSSSPQLSIVALDTNRICLSWDFEDIHTSDSSLLELVISRNENNTPYWDIEYELTTTEFNGVLITTVPKQNTAYWFRYILKYGNAEDFFFSKWTKTPKEGIDPPYDPVVLIKETSVDSITIEWLEPPLEMQNCLSHYDMYMYEMKGGDELKFKEVLCTEKNVAKFENLRTSVSYKFRLVLCVDPTCKEALYPSSLSENFVPKDRDPKFIPNVSVIKTSVASIAIAWNAPPVELQDRIYYYKVALGTEDFIKELYVHKTVHSHTFKNLSPNKIHRIKVAACSDYKTQCGNWSEEQDGFTYNTGEMIRGAAHVYANAGDPVALSCDLSGPVTKFGWRKIQGQPTSEENIIKLTESWQLSKTFRITRLYFTNSLERDAGLYECWAEDSENFSVSFLYSFHVEPSSSSPQLSIVALDTNRICLSWDFQDIHTYDSSLLELVISRNENNTPYWDIVYELTTSKFNGVVVLTVPKQNTVYWFKHLLKYRDGDDIFFSKWTKTPKEGIDLPYYPAVWIRETSVNSITIEWSTPTLEIQNCLSHYEVYMYEIKGSDEPKFKKVSQTTKNYEKFENLRSLVSYKFRLDFCADPTCEEVLYASPFSENVIPKDRDPKFTPNVSIIETGVTSIAIAWNVPPVELQDRIHYYKVAVDTEYFTKELYVDKTVNFYTFENLPLNKTHRFKVAACSDYKTQCGHWSAEREAFTHYTDSRSGIQNEILLITGGFAILLIIVILTLLAWNIRRKVLKRQLIEARLGYFNAGDPISLDPELAVSDQAELLPYHKKWEFPREFLIFDGVLGSGSFGIVKKAQARSIHQSEVITTVAVKTVRPTASLNCMKALLRELKILVYLGQHLNIVNLLGACTKNIDYGELLVIVEYCRYGNLHDYLIRRRVNFVNHLISSKGKISVSAVREEAINVNDDGKNTNGLSDGTSAMVNCPNKIAFMTTDAGVDDCSTSASSMELSAPLEYPGDRTNFNSRPTCTYDLVCWAWQVSCGMQYLSTKRIIHGDLATRNILLTDDNVVKICDFGLSKSLREEENHKSTENGPLPVKWMAIESLRDRVFSTKSDVWSFGVVLWELFSLARTPYPQIRPEDMCRILTEGYRMEKPQYAPRNIYQIMLCCWKVELSDRPSFEKLTMDIAELIEEQAKTFYLEMGNPYTKMYDDIWKGKEETAISAEELDAPEED